MCVCTCVCVCVCVCVCAFVVIWLIILSLYSDKAVNNSFHAIHLSVCENENEIATDSIVWIDFLGKPIVVDPESSCSLHLRQYLVP